MTPETLSARALELGATNAVPFTLDQIIFDQRTIRKECAGFNRAECVAPDPRSTI